MTTEKLTFRLNRAIGQIEAIKKQIDSTEDDDCLKVLQQLKASINALKKFGEAYMSEHLETCIQNGRSSKEMENNLKSVISGAFSL
ncbi:metal-sensitive transcriptional regulator [bacterium]|jgi:CsoR family transcriptional regulator, copper-sensing transcriptional repressor|nr:metal-sensitive transcriptional regulator [bacterium]